MPDKKPIITNPNKIYIVYFIIFTIIVLSVIIYGLAGNFWNYWKQIRDMETYYRNQALRQNLATPQINNLDPVKGTLDAKITIYEYSDFSCPACQNLQPALLALENFYGNKIRFVYKGLPITISPIARPAINAAYCAGEQNKFWDYKTLLYQNAALLNNQKFLELAGQLNMDSETFGQCLDSQRYSSIIDRNLTEAMRLEITSLPTIYVNKEKVEGFIDYNRLKTIIDKQL